jgi:hypothetical protein
VRRYRPDWELLSDALKRIQHTNEVTEDEAKRDLCKALSDGKIRMQLISHAKGYYVTRYAPGSSVSPHDFDWHKSRTKESCVTVHGTVGTHPVDELMISTVDVVEHLCAGVSIEHAPERQAQNENDRRTQTVPTVRSLHLSKAKAEKLVADYIEREKREGRRPTMSGLEAERKDLRGGREPLRAAFRHIMGDEVTRGRPRKSPP